MMDTPAQVATATEWGLLVLIALASVNAVVLLVLVGRASGLARRLTAIARQVERGTGPVLERTAAIADNVEGITRSVRGDVRHLTGSVRAMSDRLAQASEHMETRIGEFNALLEVAQREAEEMFLDTASAVHGMRAGARALERQPEAERSAEPKEPALPPGPVDGEPFSQHPAPASRESAGSPGAGPPCARTRA